jgi:hypothetical protein
MKLTWYGRIEPDISDLIGKSFESVTATEDELIFKGPCGTFTFYHDQDCCEHVRIEDIIGDLNDLVKAPIISAEEVNGCTPEGWCEDEFTESYTWTFYKFATKKGYVDVRWLGESNGCYSESVGLKWQPHEDYLNGTRSW